MVAISQPTNSKRSNLEPEVYSLSEFARLIGRSYTSTHEAAQRGELPVQPIRIGRVYKFPKAAVRRLLCIEPEAA